MSDIYTIIEDYNSKLEQRFSLFERILEDAPPGYLRVAKRGNAKFYYIEGLRNGTKSSKYLPKSDTETLKKYAEKKYARNMHSAIKKELKACESFLRCKNQKDESALADEMDPELLAFIPELSLSKSQFCQQWLARPYPSHNTRNEEHLIYKTLKGDMVRSKSEAMIADALYRAGVPYLYEYPLQRTKLHYPIYPDFTVLNKHNLKEFYWEHFGLMGDESYAKSAVNRINIYSDSDLVPEGQLITTLETQEQPLSSQMIEKKIEYYLL